MIRIAQTQFLSVTLLVVLSISFETVQAGSLMSSPIKNKSCTALLAGLMCVGIGCQGSLNASPTASAPANPILSAQVTEADQRLLENLLDAADARLDRPAVLYYLPQIHEAHGTKKLLDGYSGLADPLWKEILKLHPEAEDTVRSQYRILQYLEKNRHQYIFAEGHTDVETYRGLSKLMQTLIEYRNQFDKGTPRYFLEIHDQFAEIPETYDELTLSQKTLLYFGALHIALMRGKIGAILPAESDDLNRAGVDQFKDPQKQSFSIVYDEREVFALAMLSAALKKLNADKAVLIYGASHQFQDYKVPNLTIIRLTLNEDVGEGSKNSEAGSLKSHSSE